MKVALCVPNFPPEFTGGTELVSRALALALVGRGVEVLVISGSEAPWDGDDFDIEDGEGVQVRRIKRKPDEGYGLQLDRPRVQGVVDELCDAEGVDVVHVHHWYTLTDQLVRSARAKGRAVGVTLHDVWSTCPRFFRSPPGEITCPQGAGRDECAHCCALGLARDDAWCREQLALHDAELRAEFGAAQFLTTPSATCADRIATHLPWERDVFEVVPHGLLEPVQGNASQEPPEDGVLRVGTFGNLVEAKGVLLLVHACSGVPNLELHLFGPFLEDGFEELVRRHARESGVALFCHGRYSTKSRHPARNLDVAVFPSLCEETYGLVVEESLARGVPVVVSDRGALHERIGDGGTVVGVDDPTHLRAELTRLATGRSALAELRAGIPSDFMTIADAADQYVALYRRALDS